MSPALVLAWNVAHNVVNTPVWDDWERGPLIQKFREGTLTFRDLYAPHIDHRIFFPRLLILACNELSGGDLRWEMACTFLMAVGASLGVWQLARATLGPEKPVWGLLFVANMIIFSPIQWDNWLWGIQTAFLMPMTFTIWALVVCVMPWRWWVKLLVSGGLAIVGTHSFGHGFAVWPAVFGLALLIRGFADSLRARVLFLVTWALLAMVVVGCYALVDFRNSSDATHSYMQKPGDPPPSVVNHTRVLAQPAKAMHFIAVLAGSPFSRMHLVNPLKLAPVIGWALLGTFALLGLRQLWLRRRNSEEWDRALPWLALGCAALLGMAAIAIGRLNVMGFSRAASIRYVSISQYLTVAVLMLAALWWQRRCLATQLPSAQWGPLALASFVGFMVPAWSYGVQMMHLCREARLQGHAALMFINYWDPEFFWRIDGSISFPRKQANVLDRYGLLDPPLVKTLELAQFKPLNTPRPPSQATVRRFERTPDGLVRVAGHARIESRPADLVLFTWQADGTQPLIFAAAEPTAKMVQPEYPNDLELVGRLRPERHDFCLWEMTLPLERTGLAATDGPDEITVRAWVFDVIRRKAYRIAGEWRVNRSGQVVSGQGA